MNDLTQEPASAERSLNFLEEIIENSIAAGDGRVQTRFPPEPNGYLHIGHAKSICLNFGLAKKYGGKCNLRFDDTNPVKEDVEYVDSIKEDVRWLGFEWAGEHYASDYFEQLYLWAVELIKKGLAYVDDQSQEEIRLSRGTVTVPGRESPWRNRSVEENLDLFARMKAGEFADGEKVLRAKIDMAHPNMLLRDPIMYRILHAEHHRTGNTWCIYPMYDYAHGESDSIERITHSICTLEFDVHRPLYDWFIEKLGIFPSHQYEFARLNLTYTMMSKRKLLQLVQEKVVMGWDDPRMPTICALRRRGYTPESVRMFADKVGVAKRDNVIDLGLLEFCVREDLNRRAERRMAVLDPIRVVITNYPEGKTETVECVNNPEDESAGKRAVPFGRELYIERSDFMENPPKKYYRLSPGGEVSALCLPRPVRRSRQGRRRPRGGIALHLRSRIGRRQVFRRPQGEGRDPLGFGADGRSGRSAPVRPPVHARKPRRSGRRQDVRRLPQSRFAADGDGLSGALARRSRRRRTVPVRTSGVFLQGQGFFRRQTRVQPDRDAEGQLG